MQMKAQPTDTARESELARQGRGVWYAGEGEGPVSNWLSQVFLAPLLFVQIYGGYFIHYFAPRGLQPVEKNVVFVIDVSGSMFGTKLQQVTGLSLQPLKSITISPFDSAEFLCPLVFFKRLLLFF